MQATNDSPAEVLIDGTRRECLGVIAELETTMSRLHEGARVRAIVADVPSRIDVLAWAERKGHAVPIDRKEDGRFHLTIVKGGRRRRSIGRSTAREVLRCDGA